MARVICAALAILPCFVLLIPAFAVAGLCLIFARLVRGIGSLGERRHVPWTELIAFEPALGWKPRPNLDAHYLADGDDVFRIVTDDEGWPGRRSIEDSDVVVVGDSFAFGYGVDTANSFAEIEPGMRVKAVGAPGYSMVHGVRLMERIAGRLRGKAVVWFIYLENDLQDNLVPEMRQYRGPFVRRHHTTGAWEIEDGHVRVERWDCSDMDKRRLFPQMCIPGPIAERAYAASEYLLTRARGTCVQFGARLAVLTIPHPAQLTPEGRAQLAAASGRQAECDANFPDVRLAACCGRLGLPFVAGAAHLSRADYKRREGIHWNERGHRRVARLVRQLAAGAGAIPGDLASSAPERVEPFVTTADFVVTATSSRV